MNDIFVELFSEKHDVEKSEVIECWEDLYKNKSYSKFLENPLNSKKVQSKILNEFEFDKMPVGVSVKVKFLRKRNYDNLREWMSKPTNKLVTRNGRIFIGKNLDKSIFHYPRSEWANPFPVGKGKYTLEESLERYNVYLRDKLKKDSSKFLEDFEGVTEIGCFCDEGNKCHRDIILKELWNFRNKMNSKSLNLDDN